MSRRLDRARAADLTYDEVGASLGQMPAGYRHAEHEAELGPGAFERAVDALVHFDMHRGAGLRVESSAPQASVGVVVVSGIGVGPLRQWAPCRVVAMVDEPDRKGFAYGTLPGHPVRGEESFVVSRDAAGVAHLRIAAFSRPATLVARLGGPVAPRVQELVTRRYARALRG